MEGSCRQQRGCGPEDCSDESAADCPAKCEASRSDGADCKSDKRIKAGCGLEIALVQLGCGQWNPREKHPRGKQCEEGAFHEAGVAPETPACEKLAIPNSDSAARIIGTASNAPVPSPNRMSRSNKGSASNQSSNARCPCSAERCA